MNQRTIAALRMERQFLTRRANQEEYDLLFRDTQPGQNVYWHGFGEPPCITFRADFDDVSYNRQRQQTRALVKGRFQGGNLGWIMQEDLPLFAGLCRKPLEGFSEKQTILYELIQREGPMNIQLMKEMSGLLVKEITPVLHRLQETFLIYEDQYDGEWDRGWYLFTEMFPQVDLAKYSRQEALCIILPKFAYRHVAIDSKMAKSFYKLPEKEIKTALHTLVEQEKMVLEGETYLLAADSALLAQNKEPGKCIFIMHRNDFLVKSNEHVLKQQFSHPDFETLQYIFIDGVFCGAVVGKFKYGPYILEDVVLDLSEEEAALRRNEIIEEIYRINGSENQLKRFMGSKL